MSELSIDFDQRLKAAQLQQSSAPGSAVRQLGLTEASEPASIPDAMSEEADRNLEEAMGTSSSGESNYDTAESGDDEERSHGMQTAASSTRQNIPHGYFDPELAPYIPPMENLNVADVKTFVSQSRHTRLHLTELEGNITPMIPASGNRRESHGKDEILHHSADDNQLGAANQTPVAPPRTRRPPSQRTPNTARTFEEMKQMIVDKSLNKNEINNQIKLNSSDFSMSSVHYNKEYLSNVKSENDIGEYEKRDNNETYQEPTIAATNDIESFGNTDNFTALPEQYLHEADGTGHAESSATDMEYRSYETEHETNRNQETSREGVEDGEVKDDEEKMDDTPSTEQPTSTTPQPTSHSGPGSSQEEQGATGEEGKSPKEVPPGEQAAEQATGRPGDGQPTQGSLAQQLSSALNTDNNHEGMHYTLNKYSLRRL